jgi:hypothetical protein
MKEKDGLFTVHYEGWLTIAAQDQDEAQAIANRMLAESGIVNDGDSGEWELTDVADLEYYTL